MTVLTSQPRIGFRALCLRGSLYILSIGLMMQSVLHEAAAHAGEGFTEYGFTELAQSFLLLAALALAIAARVIDRTFVPLVSWLLIGLLGASLIREQDV